MLAGWSLSLGDELANAIRRQLLEDPQFARDFGPNGIQRWAYYEETGKNRTRPCYMIIVQGHRIVERISAQERGEIDVLEVVEFEERDRALAEEEPSPGAIFEWRTAVIQAAGGLRDGNGRLLPNHLTNLAGWTPPVQPGLPEKKFYAAGIVFTYAYERDLPARRIHG